MNLSGIGVTVQPLGLPVTSEQFIQHARVNGITVQVQPTLLDGKLRAAVKRGERYMRRAVLTQTITAIYTASDLVTRYSDQIWLPRGVIQSVEAVEDVSDGAAVAIAASNYVVDLDEAVITLGALYGRVRVRYVAGWEMADVPGDINDGILEYATVLYEDRTGKRETKYAAGDRKRLPPGVEDLWIGWRVEPRA